MFNIAFRVQILPERSDARAPVRGRPRRADHLPLLGVGPEHLLQGPADRRPRGARLHLRVPRRQDGAPLQQDLQGQVPGVHEVVRVRQVRHEAQGHADVHAARPRSGRGEAEGQEARGKRRC